MGRHGGGSRSGGSSSGSSRSSGSRSSGGSGRNSFRSSKTPFAGGYNRSYYGRFGRYHTYYTSDPTFGTRSGWNAGTIFALVFITIHMLLMVGGFASSFISFGGKVEGNRNRIFIEDRINLLTENEEQSLMELFDKVYERSGMPVSLYTDDFSWKDYYGSLAVYSEELYYKIGLEEDAMIILFTANKDNRFFDWEYDMYCGDDTIKCFSDAAFDDLLDNFHKSMAGEDLHDALIYSWNSVMDDLAKTDVKPEFIPIALFLLLFYGMFYMLILGGVMRTNTAYRYFKDHPEKLTSIEKTEEWDL